MTGSIPSPLLWWESSSYSKHSGWKYLKKGLIIWESNEILFEADFVSLCLMYYFPCRVLLWDTFDDNPFGHKEFVNIEIQRTGLQFAYNREIAICYKYQDAKHQKSEFTPGEIGKCVNSNPNS